MCSDLADNVGSVTLAFVDLCEQVDKSGDEELMLAARQIQLIEMVLLLKSTYYHTFN